MNLGHSIYFVLVAQVGLAADGRRALGLQHGDANPRGGAIPMRLSSTEFPTDIISSTRDNV